MLFTRKRCLSFVVLWLLAMACAVIFTLPLTHRLIAEVLATHSSTPYDRWLRRLTEYAYRPLMLTVLLPCIFFITSRKTLILLRQRTEHIGGRGYDKKWEVAFIALTTFVVMALCTTSSFLYPFNFWNDANIIYTVGKGMAHGLVPYRDLFERKGILLYFIHEIGYILSPNSFFGIFIFECIAAFFFLWLCYKTARLYTSRSVVFLLPLLAVLVYGAYNTKSGDSAEEFCLPLLMCPLYFSLRNLKRSKPFTSGELFISGLCAGCVLWIKYTMLGFFIGYIIVPSVQLIRNKQIKALLAYALFFLAGLTVATLPWCCYFTFHGSLKIWINVYVFSMILGSSGSALSPIGLLKAYTKFVPAIIHYNLHLALFMLTGFIFVLRSEKRNIKLHLLAILVFLYIFVFYKGMSQRYYSVIFGIFSVFALIPIHRLFVFLIEKYNNKVSKILVVPISLVVAILYAVTNYEFRGFMTLRRTDCPQYRFAQIIRQYENPTLLTYKFMDRGFYTYADVLPNCYYFFEMPHDGKEIVSYTENWVKEGRADFLVTEDICPKIEGYELIAEDRLFLDYGRYFDDTSYYLYKRNWLPN